MSLISYTEKTILVTKTPTTQKKLALKGIATPPLLKGFKIFLIGGLCGLPLEARHFKNL
jgi:hypothetical protein